MKRTFTLLMASLFLITGTAWAYQLSYDKTFWTVPATSHEMVTEVPSDVFTAYNGAYSGQTELAAEKVGVYVDEVDVTGGTVAVVLQYVGGNIRLDICGIDLVSADGTVKYKDYHFGYTGGNSDGNTYTLNGVEDGSYTLRVFVPSQKEDFTNANNNSKGTMTITGATRSNNIVGSTAKNKKFYYIKNVRSGKYANFEGAGVQFTQVATATLGSYWYLMEVADAQNVPEGYKAYRLYNAANTLAVENPSNGNMSENTGVTWPAKVYCIGEHTKGEYTGVVIRPLNEDGSSWNDAGGNGTAIGTYGYDDAGSIWAFEKVDVTESQLIQNAVAVKTGVLNTLSTEVTNTQRYYYGYVLSDIETKKAEIEAISVPENSLVEALTNAITISKMTSLAGLERIAPKAGDKFTMVNKGRNSGKDGLVAFAAGTDVKCLQSPFPYFDAVWTLVATGTEGQFKLYNEKMNVYVGVLPGNNNTKFQYVSAAEEAGVYELANVEGYATFKKVGGDNYSHLHQTDWGGKEIVRWDNGDGSQWQLVKPFGPELTTDADSPICYALRSGRDGNYYYTLDNNKVKLYNNKTIATEETTHWYFMLDEDGHLKMYSKSDKVAMGYLTVAAGNTKLTNDVNAEDYANNTYTLYFAPYNLTNRRDAWFALKTSCGTSYVSNFGGTGNYMGFYNNYEDDGTRIAFEGVDRLRLAAKIAECEAKEVREELGYYSVSGGDAAAALAAAKTALEGSDNAAYRSSLAALEALTYTLNLPEDGQYFRVAYDYGGNVGKLYMQGTASSVKGVAFTNETAAASIWQYRDGSLYSYTEGKNLREVGGDRGLSDTQTAVTFSASPRAEGKYNIACTSYLHANSSNGSYYTDHCDSDGGHAAHDFILEEVTELPVLNVALNKATAELTAAGATITLVATVTPEVATNKAVTWTSSDEAVATVVDGVVTAVGNGTATITATVGEFSATCEVTVAVGPEYLTVVGAKVGDVAIVEGKATVESISSFDITFDRPVVKVEDAEWAQLTDKWGDNSLKAEVLEDNNCVVRFSLQWDVFTEAGDFYLYIPEGVVADAEDANCVNAEIEAVITIEGGSVEPATPLAVVNVTVGEAVMSDLSAIVAAPEAMIKVNFDGKFYFQGEPSIVDANGDVAPLSFEYMNGLDYDGSNSYIFWGKKEGTYTITLAKTSFSNAMPSWMAPAEDIVLTVTVSKVNGIQNIIADADAVIYDIHGRRVEKMTKGLYIVNGRKVMVK